MNEITTTDISKFGARERHILTEIMNAWDKYGLPEDFSDDGVVPMLNMYSGHVFLTNNDYQVAMIGNDKLESFYSCPECGFEGWAETLEMEGEPCCSEYIKEVIG